MIEWLNKKRSMLAIGFVLALTTASAMALVPAIRDKELINLFLVFAGGLMAKEGNKSDGD